MENIQEIMKNDLKKIGIDLDTDNHYQRTSFNPEDMRRKSTYCEFIFADERGYHYINYGSRESEHVDKTFDNLEDLLHSQNGMMVIDAICMNLIALGEAVKGLDKQTHGELFPNYPEIHWSGVMRMRDKIAHHYFDIDTDVVFRTVQEDIPKMKIVIDKIIEDIKSKMSDV